MEENKQTEELTEEVSETECEAPAEEKDEATLLRERIAELEAEIKEKDDKYLRMAAEYDNFRRRSREEKDATYESAMADTVAELLPIIDNLERAANYDDGEKVKEGLAMTLKSVSAVFSAMGIEPVGNPGETFDPNIDNLERAALYDDASKVKEGLVMIAKSVSEVFAKLGVEEFGKVGETFDPNIHNAVMHVEDDAFGEGEIVEVFQKGYRKGKHIIRFAMVKSAN